MYRVQVCRINPELTPKSPNESPSAIEDVASSTLYPGEDLAQRCAMRFNESQVSAPTGLWAIVSHKKAARR
ncbi:MAG: hypothetical protein NXI22_14525 [bacterium]|nr:hypothetical protein [bacterium]